MIRLDLKREPYWLDLVPGVRVHVQPCTTAMLMAARAELSRLPRQPGEVLAELLRLLALAAIDAWEGIGDHDGEPLAPTPEAITAVMELWPFAEAFETRYLGPALVLDDEKNG